MLDVLSSIRLRYWVAWEGALLRRASWCVCVSSPPRGPVPVPS